ncbi:MAG: hypothetical protein K1X35_14765, partial [Caulobacteraceae bacterium]|nr:hypothetical protein [Caulobacteraceae bacterium]
GWNGADKIYGGTENDTVDGGAGADTLLGEAGDDTLNGGDDNDKLQGGADQDTLHGDAGADKLYGQAGADHLYGDDGDDILDGGAGGDDFDGGAGFDTVSYRSVAGGITVDVDGNSDTGDAAGDWFVSIERYWLGTGGDTFYGGAAAVEVWGIEGDDVLTGGTADDKLNGGIGNDTLAGSSGADEFVYSSGLTGADTIVDWAGGVDIIRIYGGSADEFSDLVIADSGGDTLITFPDGSTITLSHTDFNTIDANDFIFGP